MTRKATTKSLKKKRGGDGATVTLVKNPISGLPAKVIISPPGSFEGLIIVIPAGTEEI